MMAAGAGQPARGQSLAFRWGLRGAAAIVATLAILRLSWLTTPVALSYNEGWNAFQAARAMAGQGLYPPAGALIANNYPPLSFYLVGALGSAIGDQILAGRIVSGIAVLAVAAAIAAIVRRLGGGPNGVAVAVLLYLAIALGPFREYFAADDPQWLAQALMTAGVVLIVPRRGEAPTAGHAELAAVAMLAGGLVKHNLVGFAGAVTLWLAVHHRRALIAWLATGLAGGAAAAGMLQGLYGGDFWLNLLFPRRMLFDQFLAQLAPALLLLAPFGWIAGRLVARRRADDRIDLVLAMFGLSAALAILQRLGEGVGVNAYFELVVASAIVAGVAVRPDDAARAGSMRRPLFWIAMPALVAAIAFVGIGIVETVDRAAAIGHARAWIDRVRAAPGPVACVDLSLCYRAGKPFALDFFAYGERLRAGAPPTALVEALDRRRIVAAQVDTTGGFSPADCARPDHPVTVIACRWRSVVAEPGGYQWFVPR